MIVNHRKYSCILSFVCKSVKVIGVGEGGTKHEETDNVDTQVSYILSEQVDGR